VALELLRERVSAEILDPRAGFERVRTEFEIRWDPLTGQGCRLLAAGSFPPPGRHDLERLAAETREACPFCAERIEEQTPKLPPELHAAGRIRSGEAVLFPNLVPYAKWSSVSVYSPQRHLLPIDELTPELLAGNLAAQVEFVRSVRAHDPESAWASINANHLAPAGSSIFHPHLQGSANPRPTTLQRLLAEVEPARVEEYLALERDLGERIVSASAEVVWLASFAPLGPGEVRAFVLGRSSPDDLDEATIGQLARGISRVLSVYAGLGFESFNLALYGMPDGRPLELRLVARAYFGPALRSDAMWSERLHWEGAVDLAPERVAQLAREGRDES
jgi:UDPglucose--hexose-1-phosphate uridylyltransferase